MQTLYLISSGYLLPIFSMPQIAFVFKLLLNLSYILGSSINVSLSFVAKISTCAAISKYVFFDIGISIRLYPKLIK